jgi:predicted alpha/beta-fold hydrolase
MSSHARQPARREFVTGPAGRIECAVDAAQGEARGVALVAHPHPLFGGSLDNKVAQTLARSLAELGYVAWRPNFRGVGASEGTHDEGRGEVADLAAVLAHARTVSSPIGFGCARRLLFRSGDANAAGAAAHQRRARCDATGADRASQ